MHKLTLTQFFAPKLTITNRPVTHFIPKHTLVICKSRCSNIHHSRYFGMNFLKNTLTGSKASNPFIIFISSNSSSTLNPNPISLSSIFAENPSRYPKNNEPSTSKSSKFRKNTSADGKLKAKEKASSESKKLLVECAKKLEESEFPKVLSAGAMLLIDRLTKDGYLEVANFSKGHELQPNTVPKNFYSRRYLMMAAENFGRKHQQFAKWLSGRDLKVIANFGCPSIEKKSVYAAKRLRAFLRIQEEIVCRGCKFKDSCMYANKKVGRVNKVIMEDAMRLFTIYTLDSVPPQLVIPDEVNSAVSKLVIEAVNLCEP